MIVSRENQDTSVLRALKRMWHISEVSNMTTMPTRVQKILMARGYNEKQAQDISRQFTRSVMGAKYKPVAKKVLPVATHDPDTSVPIYKSINIGNLTTLPTNLPSFESLEYTGRLTKERMAKIISCIKPLRLLLVRTEEIMTMLKEQMLAGKYESSQSSYQARFFTIEKKDRSLRTSILGRAAESCIDTAFRG